MVDESGCLACKALLKARGRRKFLYTATSSRPH